MKVDIKSGSHEVRAADANNFSSNAISEAALILPNRPVSANLLTGRVRFGDARIVVNLQQADATTLFSLNTLAGSNNRI